jgi:molecular chaperone DnaK
MVTAEINLPFIAADSRGPRHLNLRLSRSEFEDMATELVDRLTGCCRQALRDAADMDKVDGIILGGATTRMPMIQKALSEALGSRSYASLDRQEAVALGAAVQAGVLGGQVKDLLLLDAIALSFSIETLGGVATPVIPRNTTIPTLMTEVFSTAADKQTQVEIHVVQGERPMAADNRSLGRFILDGIPAAPRGVPQIEVTFEIDANGLLHVSARDKATGKQISVRM